MKKAILTTLIEKLIQRINRRTGKSDSDLTSGVKSLIAGYGSGNGDAILYDGLIEINGEPAKDYIDYYEEGYAKGKAEGGGGGNYELGFTEGKAEAEAVVKPVFLSTIDATGGFRVRPVDENSSLEDIMYEFEDASLRLAKNAQMYVILNYIGSTEAYEKPFLKIIRAAEDDHFTIANDGPHACPYLIILSDKGLVFDYPYGGPILEVYDPTGTITNNDFTTDDYIVEVHNVYSPNSGESKLRKDENGFVWYVDDDNCFLCDYIGKERSITLPASYNGRTYTFWKKALTGLMVDYIHIPKELKNFFGGAFAATNPFDNDIFIVIDDPDEWFEKTFQFSNDAPLNLKARLYCNGETVKNISVPENITTIGKYQFYLNQDIESVVMHDGVKAILDYAFYQCQALKSINIPDSVTSFAGYAFAYSGLESFTFSKNINVLGGYILSYCTSLKTLTVYGNKISSAMCFGCANLTDITFNDNITVIDGNAFAGCSKITNVTVNGTIKITNNNLRFNNTNLLTVESMVNIMNALESNKGGTQYTVYFGTTNLNKLSAEQKAIATNKNIKLA